MDFLLFLNLFDLFFFPFNLISQFFFLLNSIFASIFCSFTPLKFLLSFKNLISQLFFLHSFSSPMSLSIFGQSFCFQQLESLNFSFHFLILSHFLFIFLLLFDFFVNLPQILEFLPGQFSFLSPYLLHSVLFSLLVVQLQESFLFLFRANRLAVRSVTESALVHIGTLEGVLEVLHQI